MKRTKPGRPRTTKRPAKSGETIHVHLDDDTSKLFRKVLGEQNVAELFVKSTASLFARQLIRLALESWQQVKPKPLRVPDNVP